MVHKKVYTHRAVLKRSMMRTTKMMIAMMVMIVMMLMTMLLRMMMKGHVGAPRVLNVTRSDARTT